MKNIFFHIIGVLLMSFSTLSAQVVLQKQTRGEGVVTSIRFRTDTIPVTMNKAKDALNSINKMQATDEWRLDKSDIGKLETKPLLARVCNSCPKPPPGFYTAMRDIKHHLPAL